MAVGQPQMAEFDHPQQRHTNECNESMNQSQVPGGNAQPQHDMMGGVQSQGANTSAASSSSSAMNPSLENHSLAQCDAIGDQNDQGAHIPAVGPLFSTIDPRLLAIDPMSSSSSAVDPALASRPQQVGPLRPYVQTSEGLQGSGSPCDQQQGLLRVVQLKRRV